MDGNLDAARAMLKASRYDGRKVVIISPSDQPLLAPLGEVTADLLKRLGMQVDLVAPTGAPCSPAARRRSRRTRAGGTSSTPPPSRRSS